jgi:hypothetical protein
MYRPTAGERTIAETPLVKAYTDIGRSVPGKIEARKRTAPNSKARAFHVERKWET